MSDTDPKVWVMTRKRKGIKPTFHLRWIDPDTSRWKSQKVGTSRKEADQQAALRQRELEDGTHRDIRRVSWDGFVDEHCAHITGKVNAEEARRALTEFGTVRKLTDLRRVSYADVEAFVDHVRSIGNAAATIAKKMRYIRGAFNLAIRRGYMVQNPSDGWRGEKQTKREHRILTTDEETKLLASAEKLYGFKMTVFIRFALETWARLSEATGLAWSDVDFDESCVMFRNTKSHEDRYVPFIEGSHLIDDLQRLKVMTLRDGGPFTAYADTSNLCKKWGRLVKDAGIPYLTRHDLRRTGITRALLANMAPVAVQRMAGHKNIETTMKFYVKVDRKDLRAALAGCYGAAAGLILRPFCDRGAIGL